MFNGKVLVVMGGTSTEREVSLRSGEAMLHALLESGVNAQKFVLNEENVADILKLKPDCVVLALHGKGGEDGTIQGMLELAGIPYTGSRADSSAICMNKIYTKKILAYEKISTAKFVSISRNESFDKEELVERVVKTLGKTVVVKAPCQGSSVGVEMCENEEDIKASIERVYKYDHELLFEEYISGIELTVPVIKYQNQISTLPIIQIVSENAFYDYESKYTLGLSRHIVPATLNDAIKSKVEDLAKHTYSVLNCSGLVRVDFLLSQDNIPYVMEINTLPGMTETSLVPDSAKCEGISFNKLTMMLLDNALESKREREIN